MKEKQGTESQDFPHNDLQYQLLRKQGIEFDRQRLQEAVKHLSEVDLTRVQEIAASQIQILNSYNELILNQASRSFQGAWIAASVGLLFLIGSVVFVFSTDNHDVSVLSIVSGAIIEFIAVINFRLFGRTSVQLSNFHKRIEATQRFLLANSVCEGLEGDAKQNARMELIRTISDVNH